MFCCHDMPVCGAACARPHPSGRAAGRGSSRLAPWLPHAASQLPVPCTRGHHQRLHQPTSASLRPAAPCSLPPCLPASLPPVIAAQPLLPCSTCKPQRRCHRQACVMCDGTSQREPDFTLLRQFQDCISATQLRAGLSHVTSGRSACARNHAGGAPARYHAAAGMPPLYRMAGRTAAASPVSQSLESRRCPSAGTISSCPCLGRRASVPRSTAPCCCQRLGGLVGAAPPRAAAWLNDGRLPTRCTSKWSSSSSSPPLLNCTCLAASRGRDTGLAPALAGGEGDVWRDCEAP